MAGPVSVGSSELVINKREIETTALVDDGDIVVLGGLLDQTETSSVQKVPGLGNLPGIGGLFRSTARERGKTNLMVFIRPRIIRTVDDARAVTNPRLERMRRESALTTPAGESSLDAVIRDFQRTSPAALPPPPQAQPQ